MSEVEKMYKNAGVEPKYKDYRTKNGKTYEDKNPNNRNIRLLYPSFTAEKQLELIKWLVKTRPIHITFLIDKWVIEGFVRYGKRYDTFEDALSGYINNIWQDLTEQERTEIAEILRG